MNCPCGSGQAFERCCRRFHKGESPPTAEALMRARYSAYACGEIDFLVATGADPDREAIATWQRRALFVGLRIENVDAGQESDREGFVTFSARFLEGGRLAELRERARFARVGGRWRYESGESRVVPIDLNRNDPCPCGSGQKFKKCHGR
jgi:SEC-C motif domain protein